MLRALRTAVAVSMLAALAPAMAEAQDAPASSAPLPVVTTATVREMEFVARLPVPGTLVARE